MASYESLVECVEAEISLCEQMIELLTRERKALAGLSYVDLNTCMRERRLIEAEWRQLARQRKAELAGFGLPSLTLHALAETQPPERQAAILELATRLRALISSVRREQRINLAVVRSSLSLVGDVLKLLRGGSEPRYDASAGIVGDDAGTVARWRA